MIIPDFRDFRGVGLGMVLSHSAKGSTWSKHKYVAIKNGRYIYPEDVSGNKGSNKPYEKSGGSSNKSVYDEAIEKKKLNAAKNEKNVKSAWEKYVDENLISIKPGSYTYDPKTKSFSPSKEGDQQRYMFEITTGQINNRMAHKTASEQSRGGSGNEWRRQAMEADAKKKGESGTKTVFVNASKSSKSSSTSANNSSKKSDTSKPTVSGSKSVTTWDNAKKSTYDESHPKNPTPDSGGMSTIKRNEDGSPQVSSSFSTGKKKKKKWYDGLW